MECQSGWLGQPRGADRERLAGSHTRMHIDLQRLTNIKVAIAISDNLYKTAASRRACLRRLHIRSSPMSLPHVLKRIRLELARSREFPMGWVREPWLRIRGA